MCPVDYRVQMSRSQCIDFWKWFVLHNCIPFTPIIMKLHTKTSHQSRMFPIDFGDLKQLGNNTVISRLLGEQSNHCPSVVEKIREIVAFCLWQQFPRSSPLLRDNNLTVPRSHEITVYWSLPSCHDTIQIRVFAKKDIGLTICIKKDLATIMFNFTLFCCYPNKLSSNV